MHSRKPRTNGATREEAPASSDMEKIGKIEVYEDEAIENLDIDYFLRKQYLEIRDAANELPLVMEQLNQGIARAGIDYATRIYKLEMREAKAYAQLRQEWTSKFADKMTEKALDMAMAQEETVVAEKESLRVLKECIKRMERSLENVRCKLDAMRSVESTRRKLIQDTPDREN